ncbi:methylated-DNA--[protein]-cysteine S-methyltransferase [bacterium]|nr:methylated-DNA--[protein]-cysteine S-methyltransferase [bacterium]
MSEIIWHTPIGPLKAVIGATGVRRIHFPPPAHQYPVHDATVYVLSRTGKVTPAEHDQAERLERFLAGYFSGNPPARLPDFDLSGVSDFDRKVLAACARIKFGCTSTYGELASKVGSPKAARAIGGAMARNPIPLLIPCHRVVPTAPGSLGGFGGGLPLKRWLLDHEGHNRQNE